MPHIVIVSYEARPPGNRGRGGRKPGWKLVFTGSPSPVRSVPWVSAGKVHAGDDPFRRVSGAEVGVATGE